MAALTVTCPSDSFGLSHEGSVFQSCPCQDHALQIAMIAKLRFASSSHMTNRKGAPAQVEKDVMASENSTRHKDSMPIVLVVLKSVYGAPV